jgi:nucleoid-associated protein YgaU
MKITREALKNIVKETMIEESEYQEFFKRALEKAGKSIPDMSDEEKKKFFNNIEKTWKGKGAKQEQVSELTDAQKKLPPALQKAIEKKEDKTESVEESINEGFATWEMSFSDMNLNGVKLSKKNKYKVKARNTVEAIKKAAKMAGLKGNDWIATQTNYLKKIG